MKSFGHPVTFECQLSHNVKEVAWLKNNRPIVSDKKYSMNQEGRTHQLHINHTEPDDAAEYTLSVRGKKSRAKLIPKGMQLFPVPLDYKMYLLNFYQNFSQSKFK